MKCLYIRRVKKKEIKDGCRKDILSVCFRARLHCLKKPCDISHLTKSGWVQLQETAMFIIYFVYRVLIKESINNN